MSSKSTALSTFADHSLAATINLIEYYIEDGTSLEEIPRILEEMIVNESAKEILALLRTIRKGAKQSKAEIKVQNKEREKHE